MKKVQTKEEEKFEREAILRRAFEKGIKKARTKNVNRWHDNHKDTNDPDML